MLLKLRFSVHVEILEKRLDSYINSRLKFWVGKVHHFHQGPGNVIFRFILFHFYLRFFHARKCVQCLQEATSLVREIYTIRQYKKYPIILFVCPSKSLYKHCFYFLLGLIMVPRETGSNAYAKFWRDKQRVLWYF